MSQPFTKEVLHAISQIEKYANGIDSVEELKNKPMVYDAIMMNFLLIGEVCKRFNEGLKSASPYIDWKTIDNYRELIRRKYFGIDENIVWSAIQFHLPQLKADFENLLK